MPKDRQRVTFEKVENGYVIRHSYEEQKTNDTGNTYTDYVEKSYIAKTAKDTQELITKLTKKI